MLYVCCIGVVYVLYGYCLGVVSVLYGYDVRRRNGCFFDVVFSGPSEFSII